MVATAACSSGQCYAIPTDGEAELPPTRAAAAAVAAAALAEELKHINIQYEGAEWAAKDWGGVYHKKPWAVVHPNSVDDIVRVMRAVARLNSGTGGCGARVHVAARGNGHSVYGQAQVSNGVVIDMRSLRDGHSSVVVGRDTDGSLYADVGAGRLWGEVLDVTLRQGLAPRSWTDYLYLTVGGTLQNAGVGGQTFKYGPQISNVTRLDVVTVNGDIKVCSPTSNPDLFYGSLGGLGQLGIITRARVILEPAPQKVRWIRLIYSDFRDFTHDQERLITVGAASHGWKSILGFDYVEGFIVSNSAADAASGWASVPLPHGSPFNSSKLPASSRGSPVLYCLELAKYFDTNANPTTMEQVVSALIKPLRFINGLHFQMDLGYREFLDRVHTGEHKLREIGVWDAPHPWLCIFIPKGQIQMFDAMVLKQSKLKQGVGGPLLIYPMLKSKWDDRCSVMFPELGVDDAGIFYMVAILRFNMPSSRGGPNVQSLLADNEEVLRLARATKVRYKQYMPHFNNGMVEWQDHFNTKWNSFCHLKHRWDPQAILSPGQAIFSK